MFLSGTSTGGALGRKSLGTRVLSGVGPGRPPTDDILLGRFLGRDNGTTDTRIAAKVGDKKSALLQVHPSSRTSHVAGVCQWCKCQHNLTELDVTHTVYHHIIVSDKYKFLYCYVPKVACTNWKRVIKALEGSLASTDEEIDIYEIHRKNWTYLKDYDHAGIQHRLQNYYKFMFVRDPLERLVSAYRDKFVEHPEEYFGRRYGTRIQKMYRNGVWNILGADVTFEEFVRFVIQAKGYDLNEHWQSYTELCQPCAVNYDFIGMYENLEEDTEHVLKVLGVDKKVSFPRRQEQIYNKRTTGEVLKEHLDVLPDAESYIRKLVKKYSLDYTMFGYDRPIPDAR
ncbi:PREDICTED: carbohydrate sulfotransferase 14-like [Branchiostoma belcheri]|uniref:Carbohydrate sulfotransferase n=1 Tax=Branchiostoma belcheri TaxID=7741 RepID=A0A6P4Y7U6_BRABE|nr:PREDICTED: carbohydrate sulfotransferase 14-like [Branchiostoma belcheri]